MRLRAGFNRGVNGAALTLSDIGDPDAFDLNTIGTGATFAYDNTHVALGTLAAKVATGATAANSFYAWSTKHGTLTEEWGRVYLYLTANPSAAFRFVRALSGGSFCCGIGINTNGTLRLTDSAGTNRGDTTATISLNQWIRVEYHFIYSTTAGQIELKLFNTATSSTATETKTSINTINTLASADRIRFGLTESVASVSAFWIDEIESNNTGYPGVAPTPFILDSSLVTTSALQREAALNKAASVAFSEALQKEVALNEAASIAFSETLQVEAALNQPASVALTGALQKEIALEEDGSIVLAPNVGKMVAVSMAANLSLAGAAVMSKNVDLAVQTPAAVAGSSIKGEPALDGFGGSPSLLSISGEPRGGLLAQSEMLRAGLSLRGLYSRQLDAGLSTVFELQKAAKLYLALGLATNPDLVEHVTVKVPLALAITLTPAKVRRHLISLTLQHGALFPTFYPGEDVFPSAGGLLMTPGVAQMKEYFRELDGAVEFDFDLTLQATGQVILLGGIRLTGAFKREIGLGLNEVLLLNPAVSPKAAHYLTLAEAMSMNPNVVNPALHFVELDGMMALSLSIQQFRFFSRLGAIVMPMRVNNHWLLYVFAGKSLLAVGIAPPELLSATPEKPELLTVGGYGAGSSSS